jgi:hypothetical protein
MYNSAAPLYPNLYKFNKNVNFAPSSGEDYSDIFTFNNSVNRIGQYNVSPDYMDSTMNSNLSADISLPNTTDFQNAWELKEPTTTNEANAYILGAVGIGMLFSLIFKS